MIETTFTALTKVELENLLFDTAKAAVKAALRDHLPADACREGLPEWLTRRQVSEYLSCSLATVDNYSREGLLKKHHVNGLPRFKREEVRQALEALT